MVIGVARLTGPHQADAGLAMGAGLLQTGRCLALGRTQVSAGQRQRLRAQAQAQGKAHQGNHVIEPLVKRQTLRAFRARHHTKPGEAVGQQSNQAGRHFQDDLGTEGGQLRRQGCELHRVAQTLLAPDVDAFARQGLALPDRQAQCPVNLWKFGPAPAPFVGGPTGLKVHAA